MTVRPLRPADEPAVRSLQGHLEHANSALVAAALDGPFVGFVAEAAKSDTSGVVGYAVALPGREATLSELVVAPEARRAGHGRALLERVAAAADEALVVTTPAEMGPRAFYLSLGFEPDERLPGFYPDGTDALRLVRRE